MADKNRGHREQERALGTLAAFMAELGFYFFYTKASAKGGQ
jgi:hypothetical protein